MSESDPATSPRSQDGSFRFGFRDGLPFLLVVAPYSMLFGVVASEAGLNVLEALTFSVVVIAGAAQFTAISLMLDNVPTVIVLATALTVNLRMAMYSASLTPYLGAAPTWQRAIIAYFLVDQSYACSLARFEEFPDWTLSGRVRYFAGTITPVAITWYSCTIAGAVIGSAIPGWLALDFAVPICFLALIGPMLRTPAHIAAALTSICLALVFAGLPYNLGLIAAAIPAMIVGAQVELWQVRQAARAMP